jgi:hypothetical protein
LYPLSLCGSFPNFLVVKFEPQRHKEHKRHSQKLSYFLCENPLCPLSLCGSLPNFLVVKYLNHKVTKNTKDIHKSFFYFLCENPLYPLYPLWFIS